MKENVTNNIAAIDLFCGVGGLTHGLIKAGVPVIAGYDLDDQCKYAYEHNNNAKFFSKDIKDVTANELQNLFPENAEKVMVGCAPCQTFSTHTHKIPSRDKDVKWGLINEYLAKILEVMPSVVSMENVPGLAKYPIFRDFVKSLEKAGYNVFYKVVYCPDYGIAQSRRRLVLMASLYGDIELIPPTHDKSNYPTVRDVIGSQPEISSGEQHQSDPLHKAAGLSEISAKRIRASKPGGTWLDWPEELRADCHKKDSGSTYKSVYARMKWNSLAPTITTQFYSYGTGRFGHPEQHRALSIREGALIQTFPKTYQFIEKSAPVQFLNLCRMIGNAVPVRLGEVIGLSILKHIEKQKTQEKRA